MKQRISIVNRSSGNCRTENIDGREHLVCEMLAIEGDSVMNGLLYPQDVVANAAPGLDMLPAPDGHPQSNGKPVSAFNPLAINAYNFGGFTRNPRVDGKKVIAELAVDVAVANKCKRGRKIINSLRSGKRIGVSTGLTADITEVGGELGSTPFHGRVDNIKFDHVAVLLDAPPAGENTYTLNHDEKPTRRKIPMDEITLDLTSLALGDRMLLSQLTVNELLAAVKADVSIEDATKVVENAGFQVNQLKDAQVQEFLANAEDFAEFKAKKAEKRTEVVEFIVSNSKLEAEQLETMDDAALEALSASVAPKNKRVMNGKSGGAPELVLINDDEIIAKEA